MTERCVCGCGRRAVQQHHVLYQQHIPPAARDDRRNLVAVCLECHGAHHLRSKVIRVRLLPDAVFEFAVETLGAPRAYEYLRRRYVGEDPRLGRLLEVGDAA